MNKKPVVSPRNLGILNISHDASMKKVPSAVYGGKIWVSEDPHYRCKVNSPELQYAYEDSQYKLKKNQAILMAYPNEIVQVDMSETHMWSFGDLDNFYFKGFRIYQISSTNESNPEYHRALRISGGSNDVVIRKNRFQNLASSESSWNQSVIMANHGGPGERWSIVNNYFCNILHGFGILAYSIDYVAVQRNKFEEFRDPEGQGTSHAVGAKRHNINWYINENTFDDISGNAIWLYYAKDSEGNYGNFDVSYNRINTNGSGYAITFNDKYSIVDLPIYI